MGTDIRTPPLPPIVVQPHEWEELSGILRALLPGRKVWAFGSRATAQRFSDLDLAVEGELDLRQLAKLEEALDESRLPFKVDVAQMAWLTPEFRKRIEAEMVLLQDQP